MHDAAPGFVVTNPVTTAIGVQTLRESGDSRDQLIADLTATVSRLNSRLSAIEISNEYAARAMQSAASAANPFLISPVVYPFDVTAEGDLLPKTPKTED